MRHQNRSTPAESMVETIVAITIIVISAVTAMGLLRTALQGNQVVESKIIAVNLAEEAIETFRNQRDSNYVRFPGYEDDCWDAFDISNPADCNASSHLISPQGGASGDFFIEWKASTPAIPLDVPLLGRIKRLTKTSATNLYLYEIPLRCDLTGVIAPTEFLRIYAQDGFVEPTLTGPCDGKQLPGSQYRREIRISNVTSGSFDVTVSVFWLTGSVEQSISLSRTIGHVF